MPGGRGSRVAMLLAGFVCVASAGLLYFGARASTDFRQSLRVLASWPVRTSGRPVLLLIGDSRINALRCASDLPGYALVNLGVDGLTSEGLRASLEKWTSGLPISKAALWIGVNDTINHGRNAGAVAADTLWSLGKLGARATRVANIAPIPVPPGTGRGWPFHVRDEDAAWANAASLQIQRVVRAAIAPVGAFGNVDELKLFSISPDPRDVADFADPIHLNERGNARLCSLLRHWAAAS